MPEVGMPLTISLKNCTHTFMVGFTISSRTATINKLSKKSVNSKTNVSTYAEFVLFFSMNSFQLVLIHSYTLLLVHSMVDFPFFFALSEILNCFTCATSLCQSACCSQVNIIFSNVHPPSFARHIYIFQRNPESQLSYFRVPQHLFC